MKHIPLMDLKVTAATVAELHQAIGALVASGKPGYVLSANVHGFTLAWRLPWLAEFYRRADLVHCDGAGIILAARLLGHHIPERVTYADWGWPLARFFADHGLRPFLLGGPEGLPQAAATALTRTVPDLQIAGTQHGYFPKAGRENRDVVDTINQSAADIVLVGMGMGLQERWVLDNADALGAKVYMFCGAAFRYWANWTRRCPSWMADTGFEWLFRFMQEPRRLAHRYVWGNTTFMLRVLRERTRHRWESSEYA